MRGYLQQTSGMIGEIREKKGVAMGVTGAVFNSLPLEFVAYLDLLKYTYKSKAQWLN
jgi:hypothetical protein